MSSSYMGVQLLYMRSLENPKVLQVNSGEFIVTI